MNTLKMYIIQILSMLAIILINSAMLYTYFLYMKSELSHLLLLDISLQSIILTLILVYLFNINLQVPFSTYEIEHEDFDNEVNNELSDITHHILMSLITTVPFILYMVYAV